MKGGAVKEFVGRAQALRGHLAPNGSRTDVGLPALTTEDQRNGWEGVTLAL